MSKLNLKISKTDLEVVEAGVTRLIQGNVNPNYEIREDESHLYHLIEDIKIHLPNEQRYEDAPRMVKMNPRQYDQAKTTWDRGTGINRILVHDPSVKSEAPKVEETSGDKVNTDAPKSVADIVKAIGLATTEDEVRALASLNTESVNVEKAMVAKLEELSSAE